MKYTRIADGSVASSSRSAGCGATHRHSLNARSASGKAVSAKRSFLGCNAAWLCAVCTLLLILVRPQQAVDGGRRAMRLWYTGVAPALLPFLALLPLLTGPEACAAYERLLSRWMRSLFGLPGSAAPAVVAAMLSGSPGGAIAVGNVYASGGITEMEARRLSLALAGVSPAWLVMGVGCGMLGNGAAGLKLALIQAAVQLFLLKLLEKVEITGRGIAKQAAPAATGMWRAVESTLCVCGYMVFFGAIGSALASFAGKNVSAALLAALDLPTGLSEIAAMDFAARPLAIGGALGFGGICIGVQNLDRLSVIGVRRRDYFAVRGLSAAVTAMLTALWLRGGGFNVAAGAGSVKIYGFSLLAAASFAVPGVIFISKNIFLNIRGSAMNAALSEKNRNP